MTGHVLHRCGATVRMAALAGAVLSAPAAPADPVRWPTNGHYYDIVSGNLTWGAALDAAAARSWLGARGRLVTVTSAAENVFLTDTFGGPGLESKWLGGFQLPGSIEPGQGWRWITGEPFSFLGWSPGEPNNSGGAESAIIFQHALQPWGKPWNDLNGNSPNAGYVVEFPDSPVLPPLEFPAGTAPSAIAIVNFDDDALSRPDLAVVNAGSNNVTVLLNNGVPGQPPSFSAPAPERTFPVGLGPTAVAVGAINADALPDLAVSNTTGGSVSILLRDPALGFVAGQTLSAPGAPRGVSLADLDGDGLLDLLVCRHSANLVSVFRNIGGGMFGGDAPQQPPAGPGGPSGVGTEDLDNDKDTDVVVTLDAAGAIAVFPNTSTAPGVISFGPPRLFPLGGPGAQPVSVALKDFDADGFVDVAVADKSTDAVAVFRNLGVSGGVWLGFAAPVWFQTGLAPVGVGADHVFGTGSDDLFVANGFVEPDNTSSVSLLKNVSTGPGSIAFEPEVRVAVLPFAAHVTSGDVNLDGRVDIAVASGFDATGLDSPRGSAPTGAASVLVGASTSVTLEPCEGDANGDRAIDFLDLNIVLSFYGQSAPALPGDLNADGVVDFLDLNAVLSFFGTTC